VLLRRFWRECLAATFVVCALIIWCCRLTSDYTAHISCMHDLAGYTARIACKKNLVTATGYRLAESTQTLVEKLTTKTQRHQKD
jgi:hypothetical protein